jgi:hypothetical protein
MVKSRIGIFGNCQGAEIERLFSAHKPLLERFELVPIKPVYLMTMDDRASLANSMHEFDVFVCQLIGANFDSVSTDALKAASRGRFLVFPSLFFAGHLPDLMHFRPGAIEGSPTSYHSTIIASAFDKGLAESDAVGIYEDRAGLSYPFLAENYWNGIAELRDREKVCDVTVSDFIARMGPSSRLFHTMNHPSHAVMRHVANQILDRLSVAPVPESPVDRLAMIKWPVTGAVANLFGIAKESVFPLGKATATVAELVRNYFEFYRSRPDILEMNRGRLHPKWLAI